MNRLEVLKGLKKLFSKDERWTQEHMALNDKGSSWNQEHDDSVNPCDPDAVCFCLLGGIAKVTGIRDPDRLDENPTIKLLAKQINDQSYYTLPTTTVIVFNDNPDTTIGDVRKLINKGIKELSK